MYYVDNYPPGACGAPEDFTYIFEEVDVVILKKKFV